MINIAEKLKNTPKGTELYSPVFGKCVLNDVCLCHNSFQEYIIKVVTNTGNIYSFIQFGIYLDTGENICKGECLLFPSKEVRDWSNFSIKEEKKYDFKPFDKVIVRDFDNQMWKADIFSHTMDIDGERYVCVDAAYRQCLLYNDETAKLIGTNNAYM